MLLKMDEILGQGGSNNTNSLLSIKESLISANAHLSDIAATQIQHGESLSSIESSENSVEVGNSGLEEQLEHALKILADLEIKTEQIVNLTAEDAEAQGNTISEIRSDNKSSAKSIYTFSFLLLLPLIYLIM